MAASLSFPSRQANALNIEGTDSHIDTTECMRRTLLQQFELQHLSDNLRRAGMHRFGLDGLLSLIKS